MKYQSFIVVLFALAMLLWHGCASIGMQEKEQYDPANIPKLVEKLKENPDDKDAVIKLGIIYFHQGEYERAKPILERSLELNPEEPAALFYMGLTEEHFRNNVAAISYYEQYASVPESSHYYDLMEGRHQVLLRRQIQEEMRILVAREAQLNDSDLSSQTVAVFPFSYNGSEERFSALGKGISEMLSIDLSQIDQLTVVERVRMQELQNELAVTRNVQFDAATAPRIGRLLKAGRIVGGGFDVANETLLRMDVAAWDIVEGDFPEPTREADALKNLFQLEKELVFKIIDDYGIELTAEERTAIQFIPTNNVLAFMAYCRGLEEEDRGMYIPAAQHYKEAAELDPEFDRAKSKAKSMENINQALGTAQEFMSSVQASETAGPSVDLQESIVSDRLSKVANNLGSNFVPGQDSREGAEETAVSAGSEDLADPPVPPQP